MLGAQAVGLEGVEKRIDVIAMAIQMGATVRDLAEAELCYAPQFGGAKDPVNLAGMIAVNHLDGLMPLADWATLGGTDALVVDVRERRRVRRRSRPRRDQHAAFAAAPPPRRAAARPAARALLRRRAARLLRDALPVAAGVRRRESSGGYTTYRALRAVGLLPT